MRLRGLPPAETRLAMKDILTRLKARNLPVLVAGMRAPRNLGPDYIAAFDPRFWRGLPENMTPFSIRFFWMEWPPTRN